MTNFDFHLSTPAFEAFSDVAVAAEHIYVIAPAACAMKDYRL